MTDNKQRVGHIKDATVGWKDMGDGTRRKILGYDPQMLMMRNAFASNVSGRLHSHPHVQSSYVVSGRFEITIGGVTEPMGAGDSFHVPGHVEHGAYCIEAGEIIEIFTPCRDEFIEDYRASP